jgi:uncharacterized protein YndB with AHSA1/START domain
VSDIRHAIQIAAAPEAVYPLVATARGFGEWWATDITQSGREVALGFFNRATVYRLRLVQDVAPDLADWYCESGHEWATTHLMFNLEPKGTGTLLRFTHTGWLSETDYFTSCNTTWGELMFRLKAAAEGKTRGPLFGANEVAY